MLKKFLSLSLAVMISFVAANTMVLGAEENVNKSNASMSSSIADVKKEGFKGEYIVGVDYIREQLSNPNVIFLDARGEKTAKSGKLENAIVISWQQIAQTADRNPGDEGWGHILPKEELEKILGNLGLDKNKEIIIYSDGATGWGEDGRILWELKACGYKNLKLVDGGIKAIKEADLPINNEIPTLAPVEVKIDEIKYDETINTEDLKKDYDKYVIVDSREKDEYEGATKYGEAKGGHLKGAINIPYSTLFNEKGYLKGNEEIDKIFEDAGIKKEDNIVVYCTGGIRSAYLQQLLLMEGYSNVKNYEGSYYNWSKIYDVEK